MLKKLMILLFCLMLVMPTAVFAEEGDLPVLEKPAGLEVRHDEYGTIILRMTQPDSIKRYMDEDISLHYSEVATIGKGQGSAIPDSLEAPQNLVGELKKYENGQPYFHFTFNIPKSVEDTYKVTRVWTKLDWKISNGKWATELAGVKPFEAADMLFTDNVDVDPIDEGSWDEIDIKENTYYFRAFFEMKKPDGSIVKSPFSNIVEMGSPAFYSDASDWAKPELQEAYDKGLIPDILKGEDMTKPINREEFAELAVLLYEKTTKKTASAASPNPFTDTTNKQILKAYELGITKGTSKTTFSPKVLINREECATMLYRAINAIVPDGDYSIAGVKDFPDQKYISSWAVEGTKYMFKLGIIKGDDRGYFMPKATTTAQEAAGYGMATREAAVLMTVRTSNKLSDLPAADTESTPEADASSASNLDSLISKAAGIDTGYFEALSEVSGHTTEIKYWKKGSMVKKVQTESSDNKTKIDIFDMSKGVAYSYFEGSSEAVKTVYAVSDPSKYINPFNIIEPLSLGSVGKSVETKITANETIDGVSCSVITTTVDGKTYAKIWVSEDGLKRRSETIYFGFPMTTLYKNYRIGGSISDSEFELPPGMTIDEGITVTITE